MRQCHWSRAKLYGRHSGLVGSSFGWGMVKFVTKNWRLCARAHRSGDTHSYPTTARTSSRVMRDDVFGARRDRLRVEAFALPSRQGYQAPSFREGRLKSGAFLLSKLARPPTDDHT
jgi:hypothetical protein